MSREVIARIFFFAALLFLLVQLYDVLSSFLKPIAWSILLVLVFQPVHAYALRVTSGRRGLAAGLVTLTIVLLVALPMTALSGVLAREAAALLGELSRAVDSGALNALPQRLRDSRVGHLVESYAPSLGGLNVDVGEVARAALSTAGNATVGYLGGVAKNVASLLLNLFIVLFTVFFLFRDGDRMVETVRALLPMEATARERIFARLREMLAAVVRGMVITAAVQGLITGIGLEIADVPYSAFLAVLAGVLSLFPFASSLVWIGGAIYLFAEGSVGMAIFLILWGALVVSSIDNFIRPIVIGGQARISTLLLFFGMIGGLEAYGFLGLFLGPTLMATLAAFIEIYREEYATPAPAIPPPVGRPPLAAREPSER